MIYIFLKLCHIIVELCINRGIVDTDLFAKVSYDLSAKLSCLKQDFLYMTNL